MSNHNWVSRQFFEKAAKKNVDSELVTFKKLLSGFDDQLRESLRKELEAASESPTTKQLSIPIEWNTVEWGSSISSEYTGASWYNTAGTWVGLDLVTGPSKIVEPEPDVEDVDFGE